MFEENWYLSHSSHSSNLIIHLRATVLHLMHTAVLIYQLATRFCLGPHACRHLGRTMSNLGVFHHPGATGAAHSLTQISSCTGIYADCLRPVPHAHMHIYTCTGNIGVHPLVSIGLKLSTQHMNPCTLVNP